MRKLLFAALAAMLLSAAGLGAQPVYKWTTVAMDSTFD